MVVIKVIIEDGEAISTKIFSKLQVLYLNIPFLQIATLTCKYNIKL